MTFTESFARPDSIPRLKLKELTTKIGSGSTPHGGKGVYVSDGVPFIRSQNVYFEGFQTEGLAYITDDAADALKGVKLFANDVLLNITGASVGRACIVPDALVGGRVNQHVAIIRCTAALEPRFLLGFLRTPLIQDWIWNENYGVTRQALTKGLIENLEIPLPPLAKQRSIIAKLDALTARLACARTELSRVPVLADHLRETALQRAFDGLLIDEDNEPQSHWNTVPFSDVGEIASNLVTPSTIIDLPHIAPNHIQPGRPVLLQYRTIGEDEVISSKHRFYPGQIIYSKIRPNLRKVVLVDFEGGCSADMYPINAKCHPRYLLYWMLSPQFTWLATRQDGRTVLPKINQNALRTIPTPLAPLAVQERIAALLDHIFARADRLEAEAMRAGALLDRLEAAILAKAFRDELVLQNPTDEPATARLSHIDRSGEVALKPKRWRRAAV